MSRLQVENDASILTSSGERVKYLRDPRPHFGVAHSSRSVSFALWDSDRPREMKEGKDDEEENGVDSVSCCPHCHLGLPRDTLRWHEVTRHIQMLLYFITSYNTIKKLLGLVMRKSSIVITKQKLNIGIKVLSFVNFHSYFFLCRQSVSCLKE